MNDTTLMTIIIILLEILLVLIIAVIILVIKIRASNKKIRLSSQASSTDNTIPPSLTQLLKTEIECTQQQLADTENEPGITALNKRIILLETEQAIHQVDNKPDDDFWATVEQHYQEAEIPTRPLSDNREQIYLSQIENLEKFREFFLQTQRQLADSFVTIDKLKHIIGDYNPAEDKDKLLQTIQQLEADKHELQTQLDQTLKEISNNMDTIKSGLTDNAELQESREELDNIKEENEFLVNQIQYLLQQEVESSAEMMKRIASLEETIQQKEDANNALKAQQKA